MPYFDQTGPCWGGDRRAGWRQGFCGCGHNHGPLGWRQYGSYDPTRNQLAAITNYRKSLEEELIRIKEEESLLNTDK